MIPVRVPAHAPLHIVRSGIHVGADHPMAGTGCPVCDQPLGGQPCALVYVGAHIHDRERGGAHWTGAAVAVHDECTLPAGVVGARHGETIRRPGCTPDHVLDSLGDLTLALGGDPTSFTGDLLRLIAKADPGNRSRLRIAFPRTVWAFELWQLAGPLPAGNLLAVLDGADGEVPADVVDGRPGTDV